jgi:uncharacterized lipoprotein YmbA
MTRLIAAAALSALVAGCSAPQPIRYYTLGPVEPSVAAAAAVSTVAGPSLVVGPVSVPESIDRQQIVHLGAGTRVEVSDAHRWSGSLKNDIARRIAADIARQRGLARVVAWPQASIVQPDLSLPIDVQSFEASGFDRVTLEAVWTLRKDGKDLAGRRFVATEAIQGGNYDGLAAAHGRLIDALARDIAAAIPH